MKFNVIAFLILLASPLFTYGDTPISYPENILVYDESKKYCALVTQTETTMFEKSCRFGSAIYEIEGWHPNSFILKNGSIFVSLYSGLNLVPLENPLDTIILKVWVDGKKKRDIPLGDILNSISSLERTSSHYNWGYLKSILDDRAIFETVEGRVFVDLISGKVSVN